MLVGINRACGIILNLDQQFRRRSVEWNHLCNIRRRHHEEQFCEIILNGPVVQEGMSFKNISYLELWAPFVQHRGIPCARLVEGIISHKSVNLL